MSDPVGYVVLIQAITIAFLMGLGVSYLISCYWRTRDKIEDLKRDYADKDRDYNIARARDCLREALDYLGEEGDGEP